MTIDEIRKIAELSMLDFSDEELENFQSEFATTNEKIKRIEAVNLSGVTYQIPVMEYDDLREDEVMSSSKREDTLKNAPKKDSISFILPKVVE